MCFISTKFIVKTGQLSTILNIDFFENGFIHNDIKPDSKIFSINDVFGTDE